jgi:hypothetical protein
VLAFHHSRFWQSPTRSQGKGETAMKDNHLKIVVSEGKVTMEELHKALEVAVRGVVKGGCNCGLTGFDVSFLRGDPERAALTEVNQIANIQGAILSR